MALQKTTQHNSGIEAVNAYWKIVSISGNKDSLLVQLNAYKDENSSSDGVINSVEFSFQPELNTTNFIEQAYNQAKTMPEFADATDV
jgi:hypothetical protein